MHLLNTALSEVSRLIVLAYSNPDFSPFSSADRGKWIRELYPPDRVTVLAPPNPPPNSADDYTQREYVKRFIRQQRLSVDVVFTSETYGDGFGAHLNVPHRLVDLRRTRHPISGTELRSDIHRHRAMLHPTVYQHFVQSVVRCYDVIFEPV